MRTIRLTGFILKGRYCVLEQIGKGGEGSTYLVRDMELGIYRAVKVLPYEKRREAKLLRLLSHPGLPAMVDYEEKNEHCYLFMEYIPGKTLQAHIEEGKKFEAEEVLRYGIQISGILGYLHDQKPPVFYGDLKPGNLILGKNGQIYLVDFGSAVFGYSEQPFVCMGTQGFAAPEQYQGKINRTSDVYAFGKTMTALWNGSGFCRLWKNPGLCRVLFKCCRQNAERRYPDMYEIQSALTLLWHKRNFSGKGRRFTGLLTAGILCSLLGMRIYKNTVPGTSASETPIPELSVSEASARETPASEVSARETSAPELPARETSAPELSAPETLIPELSAWEMPIPEEAAEPAAEIQTVNLDDALTELTELYYTDTFRNGTKEICRQLCVRQERLLRNLLASCEGEGQKKRIYEVLAANACCMGETEKSSHYLKQTRVQEEQNQNALEEADKENEQA